MKLAEPPCLIDQSVHALFAQQARQCPEATAVIDREGATSYGELAARVNRIADSLSAYGLEPEAPVGVLMSRRVDLVATLLGILQAGGCYVPLEPGDPPGRTQHVLAQAQCALVLGDEALLSALRAVTGQGDALANLPQLLDVGELVAAYSATSHTPRPAPGGQRLAYVLFTSGSTGVPKGVEVEHRSVVNLLCAARDLFAFTERDRYLAVATIGFDISVAELFLPLVTGGTVVLRDRELLLDPHGLAAEIRQQQVTVFQTGPPVWSVLLAEVPDFPHLRVAISTGEALPPALARRLSRVGDAVWNLYGPTETTVWATGHAVTFDDQPGSDLNARSTISEPIGQPLSNVLVRILDEHQHPVPRGSAGELWIGGAAVARAYHGNPDLTRERFVDLDLAGQPFYRTGDIVAQDAQGILHYYGRNDDQIKVRGMRVEPMEVESAILRHPGIEQAAATWFETRAGSRAIVAAVVANSNNPPTAQQLFEFLFTALPVAMVPARFVFCAELPRAPSGKIDRNEIRARTGQDAAVAPEARYLDFTDTERTLAQIWERILGVASVGKHDYFFTIGGDSLSAVNMALEVESTFNISLAVRTVFECAELTRLAAHIDRVRAQPRRDHRLAIGRAPRVKREQERPAAPVIDNTTLILPLVQQGTATPVFFNSVDLKLAQKGLWRADCSLYAVSPWAARSGFLTARSVSELARTHLEAIRAVQPQGPYRLAGYAFGGLIALEIAQQLRDASEHVELLFLLDPHAPGRLAQSAADSPASHVSPSWLTPVWAWLSYRLAHLRGSRAHPVAARLLPKSQWPRFWYATRCLAKSYRPRPYTGEVLAVFTERNRDPHWRALLGPAAEIRHLESPRAGSFSEPALAQWLEILHARLDTTT